MSPSPDAAEAAPLPDDVATLKALLLAERAMAAKLAGQNEHLRAIIKELQRALFGRRSEKAAHPDQLQLALEGLEQGSLRARPRERSTTRCGASGAYPTSRDLGKASLLPTTIHCPSVRSSSCFLQ
jgi:Transposase C of IS166 homeodomain